MSSRGHDCMTVSEYDQVAYYILMMKIKLPAINEVRQRAGRPKLVMCEEGVVWRPGPGMRMALSPPDFFDAVRACTHPVNLL